MVSTRTLCFEFDIRHFVKKKKNLIQYEIEENLTSVTCLTRLHDFHVTETSKFTDKYGKYIYRVFATVPLQKNI